MSTLASFTAESIRKLNKAYVDAINPDLDSVNSNSSIALYLSQPTIYNPNNDTTYVAVNPFKPGLITSGFYKDLNKDKTVQKTFAKYYYYKILDKWIYKELLPLLAFVEINSSGKPQLVKSIADFDVQKLAKDSEEEIEKKIKYMEEIIITKDMVRHVLKKICNENQINWYDLNKHERKIKKVFYNYLLDKLKDSINKYGNK
jgi:hypothetical protein